jgi:hypothetical protein
MNAPIYARLDEKTARSIARGRLRTIDEDICKRLKERLSRALKASSLARLFVDLETVLRDALGKLLLSFGREGRTFYWLALHPSSSQSDWMLLTYAKFNARSRTCRQYRVAELSGHAVARVLERLASTDIDRIAEEFTTDSFDALNEALRGDSRKADLVVPTKSGEFRCTFDLQKQCYVAATWVKDKPQASRGLSAVGGGTTLWGI